MFRSVFGLAVAVIALALLPAPVPGQTFVPVAATLGSPEPAPIQTDNPTLKAALERIAHRSALWREDVHAIGGNGRSVFVLTPDQVVVADSLDGARAGEFDADMVAAAAPVPEVDSRVSAVLVVVNLPLIEQVHRQKGSLPGELHVDLDLILVHEIYGHAFPYLLAGDLSGRCADPVRGERPSDACSIKRENAVRKELGLGRRTSYGLDGLALARAWR